jgi:hypothetical protein
VQAPTGTGLIVHADVVQVRGEEAVRGDERLAFGWTAGQENAVGGGGDREEAGSDVP